MYMYIYIYMPQRFDILDAAFGVPKHKTEPQSSEEKGGGGVLSPQPPQKTLVNPLHRYDFEKDNTQTSGQSDICIAIHLHINANIYI